MSVNVSVTADNSTATRGENNSPPNRSLAAAPLSVAPAIGGVLDDLGGKQGVIEHGGYTDDSRPKIVGSAVAGTVVYLYDGIELMGRVTADASGEWSYTPRLPLRDGEHVLSIIHEDPNGDISDVSAPYVIFVDQVAPDKPVILGIEDDEGRITGAIVNEGITDDNRPTIDGTTEANATVIVYDKGKEIGRAQADAIGKWSFTPEPALADGTHIFEYVAVDQAGNQSGKSGMFEFLVDTRPALADIHVADDDVGSITGMLVSGSSTDDATPTLRGTATAGGIVKIYEGAVLLGQTTAGVDGRWTFTPTTPLSDGPHALQATVTLVAKGESERSPNFNLTVDLSAPNAPSIDEVIDDMGNITGAVVNGGVTDDTRPEFQGKAEAGSTVIIRSNGSEIGRVQADSAGDWKFTPGVALAETTHSITAVAMDEVGNISGPSNVFDFSVEHAPTQTATLSAIGKDSGSSHADLLTNDGSAGRLLQGKLSAPLGAGEILHVSTDGGQTWKAALVSGETWTALDDNSHSAGWTVQTRVMNEAGNAGLMQSQVVTLDAAPPDGPTTSVVNGTSVTVTFEKNNVEEGDRISYISGDHRFEYLLTAADVAAGTVTFTPPVLNADDFSVGLVDKAGNASQYLHSSKAVKDSLDDIPRIRQGGSYTTGQGVRVTAEKKGMESSGHGYTGALFLDANGIAKFAIPHPSNWVEIEYAHTHYAPGGRIEFYAEDGTLLKQEGMIITGPTMNMVKVRHTSSVPISYVKVHVLDGADAILVGDMRWGAAQYYASPETTQALGVSGGALHGGSENNVFLVKPGSSLQNGAIFGNAGVDTIKLVGADQVLDLTVLGHKVSSIEVIDLTGTGNNTLKLGLSHVLENGAVNGFYVGDKSRVQMMVKGNAGDKVNLSDLLTDGNDFGDWVKMSAVAVDGVTYDSYQHSSLGAELLVQQGVTITVTNSGAVGVQNGYSADPVADAGQATEAAMLTLTLSQVMNEGLVNLFHDDAQGRTQMMVKGNAGDSINLDDLLGDGTDLGDWAVTGTQVIDGASYVAYQHSGLDAELLVQDAVTVNLI